MEGEGIKEMGRGKRESKGKGEGTPIFKCPVAPLELTTLIYKYAV